MEGHFRLADLAWAEGVFHVGSKLILLSQSDGFFASASRGCKSLCPSFFKQFHVSAVPFFGEICFGDEPQGG